MVGSIGGGIMNLLMEDHLNGICRALQETLTPFHPPKLLSILHLVAIIFPLLFIQTIFPMTIWSVTRSRRW